MKRYIIFFILFLFIPCFAAKSVIHDPLENTFIYNPNIIIRSDIKEDLNYFLDKYNRKWSKQTKNRVVNLLFKGQKEFDIDYKIILSIVAIESQFKIRCIGKNKKSVDYGLTQQNSKYIKKRYRKAEIYLKKYRIKCYNSKFDLSKNIFSCFIFLDEIRQHEKIIYFDQWIKAYNVGIRGSTLDSYQKVADRYYKKFRRHYEYI